MMSENSEHVILILKTELLSLRQLCQFLFPVSVRFEDCILSTYLELAGEETFVQLCFGETFEKNFFFF